MQQELQEKTEQCVVLEEDTELLGKRLGEVEKGLDSITKIRASTQEDVDRLQLVHQQ